jgi:hypothetical protein
MAGFMMRAWDYMARDGRPGDGTGGSWSAWTEEEGKGVVVGMTREG